MLLCVDMDDRGCQAGKLMKMLFLPSVATIKCSPLHKTLAVPVSYIRAFAPLMLPECSLSLLRSVSPSFLHFSVSSLLAID